MKNAPAFLLLLALLLASSVLHGQGEKSYLHDKEYNFGVLAHTKGAGGTLQFSSLARGNYRLLDFGIYSVKSPREAKLPNEILAQSRPYVFGKQYQPVIVQAAIGQRRVLAEKINQQSVRVNLNWSLGPTLAVLKPVYYEVNTNAEPGTRKKYQRFSISDIQMQDNTLGAAGFFKGIGESGFMPGGLAKASLSFEWGGFEYSFYSLETGVMVNAFPVKLPIFADSTPNDRIFVNLFLALSYGVRK
jgi:hypothetical protein